MILLGVFCPNSGKEPKLTGNGFAGKSYLLPPCGFQFIDFESVDYLAALREQRDGLVVFGQDAADWHIDTAVIGEYLAAVAVDEQFEFDLAVFEFEFCVLSLAGQHFFGDIVRDR